MVDLSESGEATMLKEFVAFLKQYGVIGLAIAVVIGGKVNDLVKSLADNLIMPLVGIFVPGGDWRSLGVTILGARFGIGAVLGSLLDFSIVAFVVFLFAKAVLKEETVTKK
jgi:large conductance mechanosensitive channel